MDIFEFVYFLVMIVYVRTICLSSSQELWKLLFQENSKIKLDIVVPVPETAIPSAIGYSQLSGVPFEMALNKNRYIHRTFIEPTQTNP